MLFFLQCCEKEYEKHHLNCCLLLVASSLNLLLKYFITESKKRSTIHYQLNLTRLFLGEKSFHFEDIPFPEALPPPKRSLSTLFSNPIHFTLELGTASTSLILGKQSQISQEEIGGEMLMCYDAITTNSNILEDSENNYSQSYQRLRYSVIQKSRKERTKVYHYC